MKKKFYKANQKGFNMFSSVVAAILLMIGIVLVGTLISTEERTSSQIYYMINSFRLNDAATIARADALQNFNYYFREEMERYLTLTDNQLITDPGFPLLNMQNYENWDDIEDTFEKVILLTDETSGRRFDAAIEYVSRKTIEQFQEGSYGRYHTTLNDRSITAQQNLKNAINRALSLQQSDKILEVVQCNESSCEMGTFYFIIPLNKIPQEDYEKLPRIIVRDIHTNEEIRIAILPRTELRIYVPLRFFKAIHEARKHAIEIESIEDKLIDARVGFCGDGCIPTSNPLNIDNGDDWDKACAGSSSQLIEQNLIGAEITGITRYNVGGGNIASIPLTAFAKAKICEASSSLGEITEGARGFRNINYGTNAGLDPDGSTSLARIPSCPYYKITASNFLVETKIISGSTATLNCGQLVGTTSQIVFEETNPAFIVTGDRLNYKIQINTGFYEKDNPTRGFCGPRAAGDTDSCVRTTGS